MAEKKTCEWKPMVKEVLVAHKKFEYASTVRQWKYCPYCGREIKRAEEKP